MFQKQAVLTSYGYGHAELKVGANDCNWIGNAQHQRRLAGARMVQAALSDCLEVLQQVCLGACQY